MKNLLSLTLFISLFGFFNNNVSAQRMGKDLIDSLLTELPKCKEDTNKVYLLNKLSRAYVILNAQEGLKYGQQGLRLSENLKWDKGSALLYNAIGRNYLVIPDYKNAEKAFKNSIKMYSKEKDLLGVGSGYINLGNVQYDQNKYADALQEYFKALKLYSGLGYKQGVEVGLCNIGVIYLDAGDSINALPVINHAIKVCKGINYKLDQSINLNNRSLIYREQKRYEESKLDCMEAMKLAKEIDNVFCQLLTYKNLGVVALKERNYAGANAYFNESLKLAKDIKSKHRIEVATGYLGRNYLEAVKDISYGENEKRGLLPGGEKVNIDTAIALLKEAVKMADENRELNYKIRYYYWLSEAYGLNGDEKNAALYKKYSDDLEESLFSKPHMKRLTKIAKKNESVLMEVYRLY